MTLALACLIIFLGAFIQSSIGFGLAIIAAPILFAIDPDYVPGPITVVGLFISLFNSYRYRQGLSFIGLKAALLGRVPGSIAGALLLVYIDARALSLWLGISVLLAVAISLLPFRFGPTPARMFTAGFFSGLISVIHDRYASRSLRS